MSNRSHRTYLAVASLLMTLVLVISACGGAPAASPTVAPPPPTAAPAKPAPTTAPTAMPAAQPTAAPTAAAVKGGVTPEQKAAALKEGEVTYYLAMTTSVANLIKERAQKDLGIKVNIGRLSSSLAYNRAVKEFEEGVNAADVIETSVIEHFLDMRKKGMLQPYIPASINLVRSPDLYDREHYWHTARIGLGAINYNTNLLKGDMIPKTWKELTDPKYKDKIVQGHIKASGTSAILDFYFVKQYGWEYMEGLKKNNVMTQQSCDQANILAQGERVVGLCDHVITAGAQLQGMPLGTVLPEDGVVGYLAPVAVLAKAPHPNAARLFYDWVTGPAGQQVYVDGGILSHLESPEIRYPSQYPDPRKVKLVIPDANDVGAWLPAARDKFSELFGG